MNKTLRRLIAILMAIALVFAMSAAVLADDEEEEEEEEQESSSASWTNTIINPEAGSQNVIQNVNVNVEVEVENEGDSGSSSAAADAATGAVQNPEKDAAAAIAPIDDARKRLRANDERLRALVHLRPAARLLQRVHETGAGGLKIVGPAFRTAERRLHKTRRGGERRIVGRGGGHDDEADLGGFHARRLKRRLRGLGGHRGRAVIRLGDVS